MVTDHERQRSRYLAGSEGAPPVPPPGGYRGARRMSEPPPDQTAQTPADEKRKPASALGWTALTGALLFAVLLLGALLSGNTDLLYGTTALALQLIVVAVVVAALFTTRGRMLGAAALTVAVLVNVATVGAASALQTSASGNYAGVKTEEQRQAEAYPGIKSTDPRTILDRQPLEDVQAAAESLFADIRSRLTAEFGYTWMRVGSEDLRPERNGYGGESMLIEFTSARWATNEPIQADERKREVMAVVAEAAAARGLWGLYPFNDPAVSGLDRSTIARLYGSEDPRTQHTWEYYADRYPSPVRFYANLYDTSHDESGGFLRTREAQRARTGEPLEGLQLVVIASGLLSAADRAEFQERLRDYPGFG